MSSVCYYKLLNKDDKFFIQLLDEKRNTISDIKSLEKNAINTYIKENENNDFIISWDEDITNDLVNVDDTLLELLLNEENFIDSNNKKIKYKKAKNVSLIIRNKEDNFDEVETSLEVNDKISNLSVITDRYFFAEGTIYEVDIIENDFYEVKDIITKIDKYELEGFLTLAMKNYKNLEIKYEDYQTIEGGEKEPIPQLIIEKISLDNSLYLKVNSIISTMGYDFLLENKVKKIVTVSELEKKIYISNIDTKSLVENIEDIIKVLTKLQRDIKVRSSYYVDNDGFIILQEDLAKEFVKKELLQFTAKYNIIGTDKLKKYNIKAIKPRIYGTFSYSIDYFEGEIDIELDGEKFSIQQLLDSYKKDTYIVLSDGTNALINKKYIEKLQKIFKDNDGKKVKVSFFDMPLVEDLIQDKISLENVKLRKNFFEGINEIDDNEETLPKLTNVKLRDYQKYGYKWLSYLMENNLGACLADDMGLGKTLQAIAILTKLHEKKNKKSIIVMPKSLIYNWQNEIMRFSKKLKVGVYYGTNRDLEILKDKKSNVVLTTYGTVRNDIEKIRKIPFDMIILDESQNIKNISSQTTKAISLIDAKHKIALSGTPIENNLMELYSLFRFLNPSMFGSAQEFNESYVIPIQKYGDQEVIAELRKKIYPFILRRIKKEVLKDLPDKIEKVVYIEMSPEHKKLYNERRAYYYKILNENINKDGIEKSKFFILQALNELRHITSSPEIKGKRISSTKKETLVENVVSAIENSHKVLIFVNYISSIDSICKSLEKNNIKYLKMTGKTKDRQNLVEKFQKDSRYKVFVMTLKTGGVGLNLTAADTIFIYDPWWNKTVENQAIDRAYRLGQDRTVFSYKLILKDSIEEKILKLQEMKSKLLEDLISEDNLSTKNLTKNDIEFILGN